MDPQAFVRLSVGSLGLRNYVPTSKSPKGVSHESNKCLCEIKLRGFPIQTASVPVICSVEGSPDPTHNNASVFYLEKSDLETLLAPACFFRTQAYLEITVFAGRQGSHCGMSSQRQQIGVFRLEVGPEWREGKSILLHNGWTAIGKNKNEEGKPRPELHLRVKLDPDPRYVFQFEDETSLNPQIVQLRGNTRQPIFSCKFSRDRRPSSLDSSINYWANFDTNSDISLERRERKGWKVVIHDLRGSAVAVACMTTPFVPATGSDHVSRSNPGAWLILHLDPLGPPESWHPWGRLEAWRESGTRDSICFRFHLLSEGQETGVLVSERQISSDKGGEFFIDMDKQTPINRPLAIQQVNGEHATASGAVGAIPGGFVMNCKVQGEGKSSKPLVQLAMRHVTCVEDAAIFMALAAAVDLSIEACRTAGGIKKRVRLLSEVLQIGDMKQLYKQPSLGSGTAGIQKPTRPLSRTSALPRSAAAYLLREHRLPFLLLGALIASSFFLLHPTLSALASDRATPSNRLVLPRRPRVYATDDQSSGASSVPAVLRAKGKRIVVTGGAGFVGSHLVDRLLARGDSVIVVDNFFTGRRENVAHHFGDPRFELIRHDVVEPILLEVDEIYHLACPASPVHYKYNPIKTIKTNVMGTLNMLGLAKRIGARFLLTSTSEVYGDPLEHPQKETYWGHVNPIGERSCYDEGKRTAETLTMDYHRGAEVEVRIARIFNTYGPRMCIDDGRVVSNFVAQALRKQPMTVYGDGKQTRSFQYVSDLVEGLITLMEGEHIGPFNLGNPGEFTMLELAEVVKETIDPSARIEFKANTADDPHMRKPDITKAKELLMWEPKVSLREGLPLMVKDFRQRLMDG